MLPGDQLEAELPPRDLPHRVTGHRGTVQSLARSMLQELQLQGAAEAEPVRGGAGGEPGGGGAAPAGGGRRGFGRLPELSDAESETSFPFPSTDISNAAQTSPFFVEGSGAPRESPQPHERGGEMDPATVIRPGVGQRSPPPPSRASTLEAVAPQLLPEIAWVDANMPLATPDSVEKYRTVQRASTTAHIRTLLSSSPAPTIPRGTSPVQLIPGVPPRVDSPLETSSSKNSNNSAETAASKASVASSFAYQMRHNLPDLRLLKQKSKPTQHTIQKPSILKIPGDIKRSPTFFKPKVVADTAMLIANKVPGSLPVPPTPVIHTLPEILREDSFIKGPLCRVQTLALPSKPLGKKMLPLPPDEKEAWQDAGRRRFSISAKDFAHVQSVAAPDPAARQLRFETPVSTAWRNEASRVMDTPPPPIGISRKSSAEKPRRSSLAVHHRHKKHYHSVTPPEEEPSVTPLHHGDSYFQTFQTFPEGTVPSKEFVPIRTPQPRERLRKEDVIRRRPESEPSPLKSAKSSTPSAHVKSSSETAVAAIPKKRKQSSIFSFFRKNAFNDDIFEVDQEEHPYHRAPQATPAATPATPGILLNSPEESSNKRRMSSVVPEMQMQSYFNRPRVRRLPSDNTLSPTGVATPSMIADEPPSPMPGKGRTRQQNRSSSEQLSPLGTPRARHRPTMESLRSRVSQTTLRATPTPRVDVRRASTTKSEKRGSLKSIGKGDRKGSVKSIGKGDRKGSVKFIDQADPLILDRNQTSMKGKPSTYFVDIRKVSSAEQLHSESRPPSDTKKARRWTLVPKLSSMSLSKISLGPLSSFANQKLRRRSSRLSSLTQESSSRATEPEPEPEPEPPNPPKPAQRGRIQPSIPVGRRFSAAELEVTEFEQTPFSQRYHDAKRALQQQIRAFVDEGLNEDDDAEGDDELVLGFEQDVPDHFPNSPLCPLHPKHKSGGKAICPLHGRYKKGMPPATLPVGKKPITKSPSYATDQHAGHHRMEIVLDTAVPEEPAVKEAVPMSVDIFGVPKDDSRIATRTSIMGIDGAISMRTNSVPLYLEQELYRGRRREKDPRGSERKRRRRVRMCRA